MTATQLVSRRTRDVFPENDVLDAGAAHLTCITLLTCLNSAGCTRKKRQTEGGDARVRVASKTLICSTLSDAAHGEQAGNEGEDAQTRAARTARASEWAHTRVFSDEGDTRAGGSGAARTAAAPSTRGGRSAAGRGGRQPAGQVRFPDSLCVVLGDHGRCFKCGRCRFGALICARQRAAIRPGLLAPLFRSVPGSMH